MQKFFNYSTLEVVLLKETRTLAIYLNRPQESNAFNFEMLFELESILSWCTGRVEIQSILIASRQENFSQGFDIDILPQMDLSQIEKVTGKLQKITQAMVNLPQTIVVDLGNSCKNIASELATAADLRIANYQTHISFEHTSIGLVPCSGGVALLSSIIGNGHARNWILSGSELDPSSLTASGFVYKLYDATTRSKVTQTILEKISNQSQIPRIQTKFGLFQAIAATTYESFEFEKKIAKASLIASDWKTDVKEKRNARDFKNEAGLKIVKAPTAPN